MLQGFSVFLSFKKLAKTKIQLHSVFLFDFINVMIQSKLLIFSYCRKKQQQLGRGTFSQYLRIIRTHFNLFK